MRRIVICADSPYPRGNASANYIQYLALSLKEAGYRVEMIVWINPEYADQIQQSGEWKGIPVSPLIIPKSSNRILNHLKKVQFYRYYLRSAFAKLNLTSDDLVIAYSSSVPILRELFRCRQKSGVKIAACPTEHFAEGTFRGKKARAYRQYYETLLPRMDLLFPISKAIRDHLASSRKPMLLLPPMADIEEYPPLPKREGVWEIVFPANSMMKDALAEMLRAITDLPSELLSNMRFHLCGVKKAQLEQLLSEEERTALMQVLCIHSWMEYSELINLYRSMHFLFLAREVNQTTLSNFPSKVPEVLCYGVVPIVTRVGEYTDGYLSDGKNAIVFDGCNRTACKEALKRALSLSWKEYQTLSANAILSAAQKFDYHVWAPKIKVSIESLWTTDAEQIQ